MDAAERSELTRDVATIVAEVMAASNERIFARIAQLTETQTQNARYMAEILARMDERLEHIEDAQAKSLEALGVIIDALRRGR
jgi:bifunctional N-acetylglucosamine-1-phosphate-uridyltransferase/glucosamine-1-phosphate-acetyltransferase GlmU-like protein